MFLLDLMQGERSQYIGIFESIESGREFARLLPGYKLELIDYESDEGSYEEETLEYDKIPDLAIVEYKGKKVPISRFSFEGDVTLVWFELSNMDDGKEGFTTGGTLVDAYLVNNDEAGDYIEKRESNFRKMKNALEDRGYQVERELFGSEDGEAVFVKRPESSQWILFTQMDPLFNEIDVENELDDMIAEYISPIEE